MLKYTGLVFLILFLNCSNKKNQIYCPSDVQTKYGDTLVFNNTVSGVARKGLNFETITDRYLRGDPSDSIENILTIEIYNRIDTSKHKLEVLVLKSNKLDENYIDFVSWVQDDRSGQFRDKERPFVIHPLTGEYNVIFNGMVIRERISNYRYDFIFSRAMKVTEWNNPNHDDMEYVFNSYAVTFHGESRREFWGDCGTVMPESIVDLLRELRVKLREPVQSLEVDSWIR